MRTAGILAVLTTLGAGGPSTSMIGRMMLEPVLWQPMARTTPTRMTQNWSSSKFSHWILSKTRKTSYRRRYGGRKTWECTNLDLIREMTLLPLVDAGKNNYKKTGIIFKLKFLFFSSPSSIILLCSNSRSEICNLWTAPNHYVTMKTLFVYLRNISFRLRRTPQ